jgi:hypothetical protein
MKIYTNSLIYYEYHDVRDMQATSAGQIVMGNRFKINYILSLIIGKTELIVDQ